MDLSTHVTNAVLSCYVDGGECRPEGDPQLLVSPATGEPWKQIYYGTASTAQWAIDTAQKALIRWKATSSADRAQHLRRVAEILIDNADALAHVMALEMGKPIREGRSEVDYSAGFFTWFAEQIEQVTETSIPSPTPNKHLSLQHEPVGVSALITPWNFPLAMPARKLAAALAAGCSVVIKPSLISPVSAVLLARACAAAGIPPGVVNVIFGDDEALGQVLTSSPIVRKLSFTGSVPVGTLLYSRCAATMKKLTLELGGHAPLLVFDDADLDLAVEGTVTGKFRNNGQTCICPNRILVQESIYDLFRDRLYSRIKILVVGDPFEEATDVSNVLHEASQIKMRLHIEDAVAKGAKLLEIDDAPYTPKLLDGVTTDMQIFQEETFGPLAGLSRFKTEEEAIRLANNSEYGLASYVFTGDKARAERCSKQLEYGIVGVNDGVPSAPQASFGGIKKSGLGREGGPTGIYEYLNEKYISTAL